MLYLNLYVDFFRFILEVYITFSLFVTLMVLYAANAVYAILFLIGVFILVGFTFVLLGAEYLGLVLMIIYIGAIAILFLFILMLLDLRNLLKQQMGSFQFLTFGFLTFFSVEYMLWVANFGPQPFPFLLSPMTVMMGLQLSPFYNDSVGVLSVVLYNSYFYYVIGCGLILLFVMLGVVLLLAESAFPFNEKLDKRNKFLVEYQSLVHNANLYSV